MSRVLLDKLPSPTASPEWGRGCQAVTVTRTREAGTNTKRPFRRHGAYNGDTRPQGARPGYVAHSPHRAVLMVASVPPPGRGLSLLQTIWVLLENLPPLPFLVGTCQASLWYLPQPLCRCVCVHAGNAVGAESQNVDAARVTPTVHIMGWPWK